MATDSDTRSNSAPQLRHPARPSGLLKVVIPYGRANASNHFAYGKDQGDRTLCGRDCYGWSVARDFEGADVEDPYSCKKCVRAI